MRGLRTAICLATLTLLAFAGEADAYIYWADAQHLTIGRAANDGTGVDDSFIPATGNIPLAVAVDPAHIYWANENSQSIGRANIDGTGVDNSFITGVTKPTGLAVNGSSIFWSSNEGPVGRANINGTGKNNNFITGPVQSCGVALDSGHVYWADIADGNPAYIGRAGLDGGSKQLTYVTIPGASFPCGVAVNSANIFWTEPGIFGGGTRIGRVSVNGGGADPSFIGDASTPCGIAAFGQQLFWTNNGAGTIARANTDGTGVNQAFVAIGPSQPCGVAVDSLAPPQQSEQPANPGAGGTDRKAPQTTIRSGPGSKLADGKARFAFKSSEPSSTFRCKLDGKRAARCQSPRVFKRLKPGSHTFRVWATDAAGNKDPTPAKRSFRIP
jgi:virginiamycin B lyase